MSYCKASQGSEKDRVIFLSEEDAKKPSTVELPPVNKEDAPQGLIKEDGTINWNCPCLGGMAVGPCGVEFREAFSCFHYSEAEPKGADCIEKFSTMQDCMKQYPKLYDEATSINPTDSDEAQAKAVEHEVAQESNSSSKELSATVSGCCWDLGIQGCCDDFLERFSGPRCGKGDERPGAIEAGCSYCEDHQCDGSVGYGGSPDENGNTRLDAMIMDGAVRSIGRIKSAAKDARHVLENAKHTLLIGDLVTDFAKQMGFKEESLNTNHSLEMWEDWKKRSCQPNFWMNVLPDPNTSCGPYKPSQGTESNDKNINIRDSGNHDTIGTVAIDGNGKLAAIMD